MEDIVKNKVNSILNKYKYLSVLILIICILFLDVNYSKSNIEYEVYINGEITNVKHRIYTENNEQYIHIEDLVSIFDDYVYNDKISGKLIITTQNKLKSIDKNDKNYVINNEDKYFKLKETMQFMEYKTIVAKNKIYLLNTECIEAKVKNNRVELYDIQTGRVVSYLNKNTNVKLQVDNKLVNDSKIVNAVVISDNKISYGYLLKKNVEYKYDVQEQEKVIKKVILVKADDSVAASTDLNNVDMIAIDMYRLSGENSLARLQYSNNLKQGVQIFATVNNGQKSVNFDQDITSSMLNSYINRQAIINKLVKISNDLSGINIDFGNLKLTYKSNYTQFIKELAASLHANNKKIILTISSTNYIDVRLIGIYVDYVIIQPYFARTLASKISGAISSLNYVENSIEQLLKNQINVDKVIVELPAYSILWTERKGTVINAQQYNMKAIELYLKTNNLEAKLDNSTGQNYVCFTKGITTYKMWLEDEFSIIEKAKIINKYNLAGISVYKSGMELNNIYKSISKVLNK